MPSTVVHVALAALLGTSLLGDEFDGRAILVVMAVAIVPDLDTFLGLWIRGGHRALLHTLLIPLAAGTVLTWDVQLRDESAVRKRWGEYGVRVAWVSIVGYAIGGVGLDLVTGGANVFYPLYDQFYDLSGQFVITNHEGIVWTFFDTAGEGTTKTVHVSSGVDPTMGVEPKNVEREFPIARSGWELLLILSAVVAVAGRWWETRNA